MTAPLVLPRKTPLKKPLLFFPGTSLQTETTLWNDCVRELQAELPEQQFNTWIRPLQAVEEGKALRLLAPNRFVVDWLQQHYVDKILQLIDRSGSALELVIEVGSRDAAPPAPARRVTAAPPLSPIASRLNATFSFENFVEGKSNQLARAAAFQVGENPG
jgi:chromosomal replication initiator protein